LPVFLNKFISGFFPQPVAPPPIRTPPRTQTASSPLLPSFIFVNRMRPYLVRAFPVEILFVHCSFVFPLPAFCSPLEVALYIWPQTRCSDSGVPISGNACFPCPEVAFPLCENLVYFVNCSAFSSFLAPRPLESRCFRRTLFSRFSSSCSAFSDFGCHPSCLSWSCVALAPSPERKYFKHCCTPNIFLSPLSGSIFLPLRGR